MAEEKTMTFIRHLEELRKVIIISLIMVSITSTLSYFLFREQLFTFVTQPLLELKVPVVYLSPTEGFLTKIKICIIAGVLLALPVIMWEGWSFVAPALHVHERKFIMKVMPVSVLLFLGGVTFAYFVVFKLVLRFLVLVAGENLTAMISFHQYISFLLAFSIPFGVVFELPVVTYFLVRFDLLTPEWLIHNRKYAILVVFIAAAALTPGPDPVSQLLMAVPMVVLYEVSVLIARMVKGRKKSIIQPE